MPEQLSANLSTALVALVLIAAAVLVVVRMVRDRKRGRGSCSCGCGGCPHAGTCHERGNSGEKDE